MIKIKPSDYKIGDKIDDMVVIDILESHPKYGRRYNVECSVCGGTKILNGTELNSKRCCTHYNKDIKGCKYVERLDENIGISMNDNTIIGVYSYCEKSRQRKYISKCSICGIEWVTFLSNFKRGYGTKHNECTHHIPKNKYLKRFRKIYSCMRYRTCNDNYPESHLYKDKGITSNYFDDFMIFYNEMFESYVQHIKIHGEKDTSLDRIDSNGNYSKENCRWATNEEQANNKSEDFSVIVYTPNGDILEFENFKTACVELKLNKGSAYNCFRINKKYKGYYISYKKNVELTGIERKFMKGE